jgi:hypothetical protein
VIRTAPAGIWHRRGQTGDGRRLGIARVKLWRSPRLPAGLRAALTTGEGRQRARARHGRKPKLTCHQRQEAIARREAGESLVDIGRSYNVSHSTGSVPA